MNRTDNYAIQAGQAKALFRTYDAQALVEKVRGKLDDQYIYVNFIGAPHRISRQTGDMERRKGDVWVDANSFGEVMTLLDLLCDSRPDRHLAGKWKAMQSFGLMFHRNLLEDAPSAAANRFDRDMEGFLRACRRLGGTPLPGCDAGFAIPLFDDLCLGVQFWRGDEEFLPRVRYLWDENALQYLRYETMYYAVDVVISQILEEMG